MDSRNVHSALDAVSRVQIALQRDCGDDCCTACYLADEFTSCDLKRRLTYTAALMFNATFRIPESSVKRIAKLYYFNTLIHCYLVVVLL